MLDALLISLKVLAIDAPILALLGAALGWVLSRWSFRGRELLGLMLQLPVIMPPSVLGFYLLFVIAKTPGLRDMGVLFSFPAAVIGSIAPSLPLMIQSARGAFGSVDRTLEEAARVLGASRLRVFFSVTLPLCRRQLGVGLALACARALGDFGVTLMLAGNVPGSTQTLPLYIYSQVETLDFGAAHLASGLLALVGVGCLFLIRVMENGRGTLH
ncbi:ABC-type molybdate transport system, permease component [Thermanaerovibrio velox DSM 12556]|uniref:ABC-type molybdate transport system, permease component n=1 Tax=Thermanaerovibrio velox DSM 12556 TaxID=926567 RepID=H0UNH0_9BACT|nr:ABC transporter permease subunit [Thermanaerovibrio velox]EHM09377.1 ABC-type molybdate transport system, permease component [Thermanaerovibrio velox DSM 12556]